MFVDTPGFVIGTEPERQRAPGKIMNFMNALSLVTVPKISRGPAQELRPGLSQHGRRAQLRRGGGVAHGRNQLHGPAVRGAASCTASTPGDPGYRRAACRKWTRGSAVWDIAVDVRGAVGGPAASETRDYLIRMLDVHRLRLTSGVGAAPDARLADELLMTP